MLRGVSVAGSIRICLLWSGTHRRRLMCEPFARAARRVIVPLHELVNLVDVSPCRDHADRMAGLHCRALARAARVRAVRSRIAAPRRPVRPQESSTTGKSVISLPPTMSRIPDPRSRSSERLAINRNGTSSNARSRLLGS